MEITLKATSAKEARREILERFPNGGIYHGFDERGECVIMSSVQAAENNHSAVTVTRNRSSKAVKFTYMPFEAKSR